MKKLFTIVVLCFAAIVNLSAQDLLFKTDNTVIECFIQKITPDMVEYKTSDNPNGPVMSDYKKSFMKVRYANGKTENFTQNIPVTVQTPVPAQVPVPTYAPTTTLPVPTPPVINTTENARANCEKGKQDSKVYYTGEKCGATGTGFACLLTPIGGLIAYSIHLGKPIPQQNLKYPDNKLWENNDYKQCYTDTAVATKKKKLGGALLAGSGIWALLLLIF